MNKNKYLKLREELNDLIKSARENAEDNGVPPEKMNDFLEVVALKFLDDNKVTIKEFREAASQFKNIETAVNEAVEKQENNYSEMIDRMANESRMRMDMLEEDMKKMKNTPPKIIYETKIIREVVKEKPQIIKTEVQTKEIIKQELDKTELENLREEFKQLQLATVDFIGNTGKEFSRVDDLTGRFDRLEQDVNWSLGKLKRHTLSGSEWDSAVSDQRYYTKAQVDAKISVENTWDRSGTTLTQHNANDSLSLGSGDVTTTGIITAGKIIGNVSANTTNVISPIAFNLDGSGQLTASSGSQRFAAINPIINQSGTAGYEALCINATEIGTGSGDRKLLCLMRNSVGVASVDSAGLGTLANIIDNGLTASLGVYTSATKQLTSTPPTSGILGYWTRTGTTLSQANANDALSLGSGSILTTGTLGAGATTLTGNLTFTDNLYDIGASGATRPRDLFLSRNLTIGGNAQLGDAVSDYHGINATPSSEIMLNTAQTLTTSTPGTQPASAWKLVQNLGGNNGVGAAKVGKGINFVQTITGNNSSTFNNSYNWGINFLQTDQTVASNNCIKTNWGVYSVASWAGTNSGAFALSELGGYFEGSGDFTGNNTYHFGIDCVASGTALVNYGARVNSSGATTNWGFYNVSSAHNQFGVTGSNSSFGLADTTVPTAKIHVGAGTATAGTAPLKFNSGTLLTTAEAGAVEFLTDKFYGTITTGAARKEFTLNDAALTSGRVPFATTNGRLTDSANLTWNGTVLGVTGSVSASTNVLTPVIKTDTTTPTDLTITTGSQKTIALGTSVWKDVFFPQGSPKSTGAGNPTLVTWDGNIRGYSYAVNDAYDGDPQEFPHDGKQGATTASIHIHWVNQTNVAATRGVKWQVEYDIRNIGSDFGTTTTISAEETVPANTPVGRHFLTTIGTFTTPNIGAIMAIRITRIAAAGTAPATDPVMLGCHYHYEVDTIGSRQITTK